MGHEKGMRSSKLMLTASPSGWIGKGDLNGIGLEAGKLIKDYCNGQRKWRCGCEL